MFQSFKALDVANYDFSVMYIIIIQLYYIYDIAICFSINFKKCLEIVYIQYTTEN